MWLTAIVEWNERHWITILIACIQIITLNVWWICDFIKWKWRLEWWMIERDENRCLVRVRSLMRQKPCISLYWKIACSFQFANKQTNKQTTKSAILISFRWFNAIQNPLLCIHRINGILFFRYVWFWFSLFEIVFC